MSLKQIFKKVLIPCAAGLTADNHTYGPNCVKRTEESRPSSLPIYSNECSICGRSQKKEEPPTQMEEAVGNIRKELWVWQDNIKGYRHKFVDVYKERFQQVDSAIQYLQEETHSPQRAGAIAVSGLAGYIWGMRHCSMIRRFFCTACGALSMAALCYPKESVQYFHTFVHEGKRYFIVAYHFITGENPKMPEWLSKFMPKDVKEEKSKSDERKTVTEFFRPRRNPIRKYVEHHIGQADAENSRLEQGNPEEAVQL